MEILEMGHPTDGVFDVTGWEWCTSIELWHKPTYPLISCFNKAADVLEEVGLLLVGTCLMGLMTSLTRMVGLRAATNWTTDPVWFCPIWLGL